ncbi:hypothetical protein [Methyloprofundus sp.]|uniref:hypothetical protein n=1 Tax=Methyloprofundus sp. TaxID=2020875 RepID=UPI003D107E86
MKKMTYLLTVIGAIQIILGIFYLFFPEFILKSIGHSIPQANIYYPLAMLAARFIAYGIALIYIAKEPLNLETAVEQGFCGKSECERQGTASRQWP